MLNNKHNNHVTVNTRNYAESFLERSEVKCPICMDRASTTNGQVPSAAIFPTEKCNFESFALNAEHLRHRAEHCLAATINSRFERRVNGWFQVNVHGTCEQTIQSLKQFYLDFDIFFHPNGDQYEDLPLYVLPSPKKINIQNALADKTFFEASEQGCWPLSRTVITEVLDVFEEHGLKSIDHVLAGAEFWYQRNVTYGDETEPETLCKLLLTVADCLDEIASDTYTGED